MRVIVHRRSLAVPREFPTARIALFRAGGGGAAATTIVDVLAQLRGGSLAMADDDLLPANAAVLAWPPPRPLYGTHTGPRPAASPPPAFVPENACLIDLCALYAGVALPPEIDVLRPPTAASDGATCDAALLARLAPAIVDLDTGAGAAGTSAHVCCTLEIFAGRGRDLFSSPDALSFPRKDADDRVVAFARFFLGRTGGAQARPLCWPPFGIDWLIRDPAKRCAARPFCRYAELFAEMHGFWTQVKR